MKVAADYVIVGAGLTGATVARVLTDAGRDVVVLERRAEAGGNVRDAVHGLTGIRYGVYGPHYFRTHSDRIWEWVTRFRPFYRFEARVMTYVGDAVGYVRWPLRSDQADLVPTVIDGYNRKMWGTEYVPSEVRRRAAFRDDDDPRLMLHKHQGLPCGGYAGWVDEMLKGIPVRTGFDYISRAADVTARKMTVYTGPIDELYGYDLGRLAYRGQQRTLRYFPRVTGPVQPNAPQLNRPDPDVPWLRSVEWNHLAEAPDWSYGALVTYETPHTPADPDGYEYPFNDGVNRTLYGLYATRAVSDDKMIVCGRLGAFKYLDMDQSIAHGLTVAEKILRGNPS